MTVQFHLSSYPLVYWSDPRTGYVLPAGASGPATLALKYAWTELGGCFVMVGEPVLPNAPAQQAFADAVHAFVATPGMEDTRFAWFTDPTRTSGPLIGPALAFTGPPDGNGRAVLRSTASFGFGGVELVLTPGVTLTLADAGFGVSPGSGAVYLHGPDDVRLDVVAGPASLDLGGPAPGAFALPLHLGVTGGIDDLAHLDAGFRVFFPTGADAAVDSHRYPLVASGEAVAMAATLDPTAPLDPARTVLRFTGTSPIPSCYVTNTGHPYSLTPTGTSALVFAPRPTDTSGGAAPASYLTPSGTFTLDRPGSDLMCGISGLEYLKLPASTPSVITFTPGRPAYAGGTGTVPLSASATTSWASVECQGQAIAYCAQPDDATLYLPTNEPGAAYPALGYLEVPAATLPASTEVLLPLFPYDGVTATDAPSCRAIEAGAISPARRLAVDLAGSASSSVGDDAAASAPDAAVEVVTGATPQGLLAMFSPDLQWLSQLTLARNADGTELAFQGIPIGTATWSALQRNQLFLAVSDPTPLRPYLAGVRAQLRADGWTFDVNPVEGGGWRPIDDEHPTFLVLKFAGQSFRELAASPASWAYPGDFNAGDPMTASAKLVAYVEDAIARAADDPNLAWFAGTVLQDPNWNGVVAINCHTPIDGWPPQLQGLAAGIDEPNLLAHHAGVQVTPVTNSEGTLALEPSSVFGLIEYEDPTPFPPSPAPYDFKVARLEVLVANSHVAGFAGQVLLQVNELFGEPATCTDVVDNNLVFNGTYQRTNGEGSYAFLLAGQSHVDMRSAVLESVLLERAEFVTAAEPAPGGTIQTRFQLWGTMAFRALDDFDAFGFDALRFAGLAIAMAVTPAGSPGLPPAKAMVFDAGDLAFDLDGSTARPTSLYSSFPLTVTGFVAPGPLTRPTDLGYAPVSTPIPADELGAPWYGLVQQLELGSQGAWARAGSFAAGLLVAWGPTSDEDRPDVFVGLQLPGTTGSQLEMTLEGPLKLGLKHVAIDVDRGAYRLWMQSLALGFFGLRFPRGRTDVLLVATGDGSRTLGWYAVYDTSSSASQAGGNRTEVGA